MNADESARKRTPGYPGYKAARVFLDSLKSVPCVVCGLIDPVVMEFDHRDHHSKSFELSQAIRDYSLLRADRIKFRDNYQKLVLEHGWYGAMNLEAAKCDIICANDHRRRTHKAKLRPGYFTSEVVAMPDSQLRLSL